jgi:hypothetical protein
MSGHPIVFLRQTPVKNNRQAHKQSKQSQKSNSIGSNFLFSNVLGGKLANNHNEEGSRDQQSQLKPPQTPSSF